jgi:hypothetical protein
VHPDKPVILAGFPGIPIRTVTGGGTMKKKSTQRRRRPEESEQKMLENLFITYANTPLRNNPENFSKIFDEILPYLYEHEKAGKKESEFEQKIAEQKIRSILSHIVDFSKRNDPGRLFGQIMRRKPGEDFNWEVTGRLSQLIAFGAVFGDPRGQGREDRCEGTTCHLDARKWQVWMGRARKKETRCYECYQQYFIDRLSEIAEGTPLREVTEHLGPGTFAFDDFTGFRDAVLRAVNPTAGRAEGESRLILPMSQVDGAWRFDDILPGTFEKLYFRSAYESIITEAYLNRAGKLRRRSYFSIQELVAPMSGKPEKDLFDVGTRFADFLCSLVGYSLSEFLLENEKNILKVRRCQECREFYVSKTVRDQKFCSGPGRCRHASHYRKHRNELLKDKKETERILQEATPAKQEKTGASQRKKAIQRK